MICRLLVEASSTCTNRGIELFGEKRHLLTITHWGNYQPRVEERCVTQLHSFEHDPDPSPIGSGICDDIRPGVIQVATGAWLDPDGSLCRRGNPNTLTLDKGTSRLAQGPVAHSCLVKIEAKE